MTNPQSTRINTTNPVIFWAVLGAAFLALAAYIWGAWLLSPVFTPAPVGPDPLPHNVWLTVRICEALGAGTGLFVFVKFLLLPLLREKHLTLDGMLVINFLLIWWMDPIVNYFNYSFSYNSHTFNMSSWAAFIPGYSYPNPQNFPEPIFMMGGFYLGFWMLTAVFGCWLMRKMQEANFGSGIIVRLFVIFATMFTIDMLVELVILRTGLAAYPGVVSAFSIFPGEIFQWPLYEGLGVGLACVGYTSLRYFKDDKGRTFVEKGIEKLTLSSAKKRVVTFFALAGFIQPMMLFGFYLSYNVFVPHIDSFPAYPSYIRNMTCGEYTAYACPNKEWVPIPNRSSKNYIGPNDPRLPKELQDLQGISATGKDPYAND